MKSVFTIYPEFCAEAQQNGTAYGPSGYDPLLRSFEYEILLQVDEQDYQGDSFLIYRDETHYGLLIFGWGSCSGCDMLQACETVEDLEYLQKQLFDKIQWHDSAASLLKYINEKDWETEFIWFSDEAKEFLAKAKELLATLS